MTRRLAVLFGCALLLGACAQPSAGDVVATRVALAPLVDATLTALVPTLTPLPPLPPPPTATPDSYAPPPSPAARPPTPEGTPYSGTRDAGYPVPPRPPALRPTRTLLSGPTPTPTHTSLPSPTPTATLTPLPTRTHGAYLGPLAEVVFLRQGNLWLAEVGGGGERQLTFEVGDWTVDEYVLDGLRIFYLARRWTASRGGYDAPAYAPQETIGRLLDLTSGEHRTLLDDLPPGSAHILAARPGEVDVLIAMRQALRVDLVTGEREPLERAEESRLSPDGRYEARLAVQLAGHTAYPAGELRVTDHEAGEDWSLDVDWYPPEDAGEHWFRGWSPDGRYLLVAGRRKGPGAIYETLCLADLSARTTHVLNPTGEIALRAGAWAPGADLIYASGCRAPEHANLALRCSVGVVDPESEVYAELEHPLPFEAREIAWLDGEWLLFTERRLGSCDAWRQCGAGDTMVWAARRDGSALSPVLWAAGSLQVLEKSAP